MGNHKIIHAHIYDPQRSLFKANKNDRALCFSVSCCNSENCDLFKRGECCSIGVNSIKCKYGVCTRSPGYTRRASKFYSWMRNKKDLYKDVLNNLNSTSKVMATIGDFIYLPYSFMDMNKNIPIEGGGGFWSGGCFLPKESFNIETIVNICTFRPQAMMGGEIKSYQKEQIPKFVKHLSEQFPELYKELCSKLEHIASISLTNVGREAYLNTLKPNVGEFVDIHNATWSWDGEWLSSKNTRASFMLTSKFDELKIKPNKDAVVKITDNNQVCNNTVFYKS